MKINKILCGHQGQYELLEHRIKRLLLTSH